MQEPTNTSHLEHLKKLLDESEAAYLAELNRLAAESAKLGITPEFIAGELDLAVLSTAGAERE